MSKTVVEMHRGLIWVKNAQLIDAPRMRIYPQWDSLRGDPRFENIVTALAPKT